MKIESTDPLQPGAASPNSAKPSKQKAHGPTFADMLDKTIAATPETETHRQVTGMSSMGATMGPMQSAKAANCAMAGDVLDAMQHYHDQLADPAVTLRQLSPQLTRLEAVAGKAGAVLATIPEDDPVKPIISEAVAEIRREIERFNSGVYVDM